MITSTAKILYKREDMNKGHSLLQDVLLNWNLGPFISVLYPQKKYLRYIANLTKNLSLINQK